MIKISALLFIILTLSLPVQAKSEKIYQEKDLSPCTTNKKLMCDQTQKPADGKMEARDGKKMVATMTISAGEVIETQEFWDNGKLYIKQSNFGKPTYAVECYYATGKKMFEKKKDSNILTIWDKNGKVLQKGNIPSGSLVYPRLMLVWMGGEREDGVFVFQNEPYTGVWVFDEEDPGEERVKVVGILLMKNGKMTHQKIFGF